MHTVYSINNISIRLTEERWYHIVENHDELAGRTEDILETIANPDIIVKGIAGELLAVRKIGVEYLIVIYKETKQDGFIITAFESTRLSYILKKKTLWKKQS